jgi:hypothetical protein
MRPASFDPGKDLAEVKGAAMEYGRVKVMIQAIEESYDRFKAPDAMQVYLMLRRTAIPASREIRKASAESCYSNRVMVML